MNMRHKIGRVISQRNLERLRAIRDALQAILDDAGEQFGEDIAQLPDGSGFFIAEMANKAVMLKRAADGQRLVGLITSNAYRDRDDEIVAETALREWVDEQWDSGRYKGDNVLLFWHDGPPIGDIIYSDMRGPFLIEIAKERATRHARLIFDLVERLPVEWGVSQGFKYRRSDRRKNGVFRRIRKFETSILPRAYAANPYTYAKVKAMNRIRARFLKKHLPEALDLEKRLSQIADEAASTLDKAGVERKAADAQKALDIDVLTTALVDMVSELLGDKTPDDLDARVRGLIKAAITDDDEPDDGEDADGEEDETSERMIRTRQTELLGQLIDDLAVLEEVDDRLKALEPLAKLPESIAKLEKRMRRVEKALSGGPRAASAADESEIDEDDPLTERHEEKQADEALDRILPGLLTR